MAAAAAHPRLTNHDGEGWHLHYRDADQTLPRVLSAVISVGTALHLTTRGIHRLARCEAGKSPGEPCRRVVVDISRNGTQRYCSSPVPTGPACAATAPDIEANPETNSAVAVHASRSLHGGDQLSSRSFEVISPPASPVLTVPWGSNRSACTSWAAFGQCSTPFGTTNTSFRPRTTSRSLS
jgi:hypothetical protein